MEEDQVTIPTHIFPVFGESEFTPEEEKTLRKFLSEKVGISQVQQREGPANSMNYSKR